MKRTLFRIVILMLLAGTFVTIFGFSNQNGESSSSVSRKVARKIINVFPYTKDLSETTKTKIVERSQPILIMTFISTYNVKLLKKFIISILVGLSYAISDEFHQSFIPGRTASPIDVIIDTVGVFTGIIIVLILISVYKALFKEVRE